ncbi:MAG: thiamine pyrophosphate-binding protein [Desulfobacterales bacterium]|nr:thiamine pyrophosphate-binding protein [Desulfobacterales bacterium]
MKGLNALAEILRKESVKFVFGYGGGGFDFWDALYEDQQIKPILTRIETSCVFMAMAHARLTRNPGITFTSAGPGAANLTAGLLEAYSACAPVISIAPSTSQRFEGMGVLQETDMVSTFKQITKWSVRIPVPEKIPWVMRRAFYLALNGKPGPIFVEIPGDVGGADAEIPEYTPAERMVRCRGDPNRIGEATNLLLKAERPVIVAGGGVVLSKAFEELRQFAELLGIPIMTTPMGRGCIPEDHPLALGLVGIYWTKVGKKVYEESDLVISIGSRNEDLESGRFTYFPEGAKLIQIDIDPFELGRNYLPDVAIFGDAKMVLTDLMQSMGSKIEKKGMESQRIKELLKVKEEYEAVVEAECRSDSVPIKTRRVVKTLSEVFGRDTILSNENGMMDLWSYYFPYYKVLDIGGCIGMTDQTCMGMGVTQAIGAKLTLPEKKVVCTTGDAAFQMFSKELATAVQYKAPVTWVVLNNFSLGWDKYIQKVFYDERFVLSDFEFQPDFVKIAEAYKCYGEHVEEPGDVESTLRNALKANEEGIPAVVEFVVDPWDRPEGFDEWHLRRAERPRKIF